jgi:luciferase family oxidoreductase group 1
MGYHLSLLDKSPVQPGEPASAALSRTVALAKAAERLGYHRFWLAEHHGMKVLASSVPEILIAYILSQTSSIRVGSGGVMLQHYAPYKVAETFNMLSALAPGRVDLGVGKSPGGFPYSTKALQSGRDAAHADDFRGLLGELDGYVTGSPGALAAPLPPIAPDRFLLGASVESAILAGELGWRFVFAGQFNGDPELIARAFAAYADLTDLSPLLAVGAFVAPTQTLAEEKVSSLRVFKVRLPGRPSVNLGSPEQAAEYARQAGADDYEVSETQPKILAGTPDHVRRELDRLHERFGVGEFIIDTPVAGEADRFRSIELLAREVLAPPSLAPVAVSTAQ